MDIVMKESTKNLLKLMGGFVLIFLSSVLSIALLFVGANYYLLVSGRAKNPVFIEWTVDGTIYSQNYIYWAKSLCQKQTNECKHKEERFVTDKVMTFDPYGVKDNTRCVKFLFLGDSFTVAPWTRDENMYTSRVARGYAEQKKTCATRLILATGGAGNDQELVRFMDVVQEIKPDVVIWQFFQNDAFENVIQAIYSVDHDELKRKTVWKNTLYLSGFLNQKTPFIQGSVLGRHLLAIGEKNDIFGYWDVNPYDLSSLISYNKKKVPLLLKRMEEVAKTQGFTLYLTMAPLECEEVSGQRCDSWINQTNIMLRDILKSTKYYVDMERNDLVLGATTVPRETKSKERFFGPTQDKNLPGGRHLTPEGNVYYGDILSANILLKEKD